MTFCPFIYRSTGLFWDWIDVAKSVWFGTEVFRNLGSSGLSLKERFSVNRELVGPQGGGGRGSISASL